MRIVVVVGLCCISVHHFLVFYTTSHFHSPIFCFVHQSSLLFTNPLSYSPILSLIPLIFFVICRLSTYDSLYVSAVRLIKCHSSSFIFFVFFFFFIFFSFSFFLFFSFFFLLLLVFLFLFFTFLNLFFSYFLLS